LHEEGVALVRVEKADVMSQIDDSTIGGPDRAAKLADLITMLTNGAGSLPS